jgi:ABC-2 type transport system permease protein
MSASLRVFAIGGAISYRALFNWMSPRIYIPTMLGAPLFQILFFTYLGRYAGSQDDAFFIVGNAIQVAAMSGIYGMTMGIANERQYGTLQPLLATPANRLAIFTGRALPFIVNGLAVSAFGFAVSWLLLDFRPAEGSVPALALAVLVTTCSCVSLGMLIGSIGLRARDVFFGANLVYFLMLLVCGVNVANDDLPGWLAAIGRGLPLTHGIEAAREIASGSSLGDVAGLLWTEVLVGVAYATAAYVLFRVFESEGRRRASLETY